MPGAVFVPAQLNDLSVDVQLTGVARGDLVFRGLTKFNNLPAGASGQFLRTNGAGADPSWATVSAGATNLDGLSDVNLPTAAQGDLLYRNATEWVRLVAGTSGDVLTTGGTAANPTWVTPGSAAGSVIIAPATGTRNDIQPTADVTMLRLLARVAGQTNPLMTALNTSGVAQARILASGLFSSPDTGITSERFGSGSIATGNYTATFGYISQATGSAACAFGYNAQATTADSAAFGSNALAGGSAGLALGGSASAGGSFAVAVGKQANASGAGGLAYGATSVASGTESIAIGGGCVSSATASTAIGSSSNASHSGSICIGKAVTSTAANQFIAGSASAMIFDVYFGSGVAVAAPVAYTINGSGGSGTNIAGANLTLAGGKGTGSAAGGSLLFATSPAGSSGLALNALTTRVTIDGAAGWISCPGAGTASERFGNGSLAAGNDSVAFGNAANAQTPGANIAIGRSASALSHAAGAGSIAIGKNAATSFGGSIAIGMGAVAPGDRHVMIGDGALGAAGQHQCTAVGSGAQSTVQGAVSLGCTALATQVGAVAIGFQAAASGANAFGLGRDCVAGHNGSVVIGYSQSSTATGQFLSGGTPAGYEITNVFIGNGVTHITPASITYNATGGSGTNIAGGNLTLAGGKGTGSANGGDLIMQSTIPGSSGTTLNSLQEKFRISNLGVTTWSKRSTTADRQTLDITPTLVVATDASRTARAVFNVWDTAAREVMRFEASGAAAMLSHFGVAAVVQQANASQAGITAVADANARTALQAIYNLLAAYGLAPATA